MEIVVFSGFSKKINSTKRPSGGSTLNVKLKQPCSVMKPQFLISGFNTTWNYIEWGSRYYYVDDITIETNDLATYSCTLDVLATFRGDILGSTQYVTRNANTYQPYLTDSKYPALNRATMTSRLINTWNESLNNTGCYVIGVVNEEAVGGVAHYCIPAGSNIFKNFVAYMFAGSWLDGTSDITEEIQKELINPFQYVVSCNWFPITARGSLTALKFGYWNSGLSALLMSESERTVVLEATAELPRHPQQSEYGIGMNGSPYTRFNFDCWCFGSIPIDPLPFVANNAIGFRIAVDMFTGAAKLIITNADGGRVVTVNGNFGVPIQLSQITNPVLAPSLNVLGAVSSTVAGFVTGNVVGGVVGAVSGVADSIKSAMPQMMTSGATGSKIAFNSVPMITASFYSLPSIDATRLGRPLCSAHVLSSLSGFTQCENVALDTSASDEEKREIISYMTSGFYIE